MVGKSNGKSGGLSQPLIMKSMTSLEWASDNTGATVCLLFYQSVLFSLYTSSCEYQIGFDNYL